MEAPMIARIRVERAKPKRHKANRRHLTEQNVQSLPGKVKQYLIWDQGTGAARGLAILVSPTGTKSYRCVYYFTGSAKPHWKHLGRVGEMTLAKARELTLKARGDAREGIDPRADDATKSDNFKTAIESYIQHEQIGKRNNRSAHATKSIMLSSCAEWHDRPIATIRPGEIEKLLWSMRDGDVGKELKPRPYMVNRLYSHLKHFFGWCARPNGPIKSSPMTNMEKPWNGAKPGERDWFKKQAADHAIKALWKTADELGGDKGRYLKTMLVTGKRKTALLGMRWDHIDDDWFWDAPASEVKNKRLHGIPLPALAQRILHPRKAQGNVFGAMSDHALNGLQAEIRVMSGVEDFFWHGLRHLAETKTAELRDPQGHPLILPHIRDLLFDHASQRGSGEGYDLTTTNPRCGRHSRHGPAISRV
jgi:integrase